MKMLKGMSLCATTAICLASAAHAQTATATATPAPAMMTAEMTPASSTMPTMNAMPVSGTVLRYYVDQAGFVSAMDVQTTEGIRMVRFAPSMAQRLTMMYPVGSTADVYVTSTTTGGMTRYDLAGAGKTMPVPGAMMMPVMVTDLDVLRAQPMITIGAKAMTFSGTLTGSVSDPNTGEVLALVVEKDDQKMLVRVPAENRLIGSMGVPDGVAPLVKDAMITGYGYEEAPRYGVVSPYAKRIVANSLSVNGRSLGPLGFGRMSKGATLFGGGITGMAPEEVNAGMMGYQTYMVAPAPAPAPAPTPAM